MASFTYTWNASFEGLPPDTGEEASLGAQRIRDLKKAIKERMAIDHYIAGDEHDGKHKKVTLKPQAEDPTLETGDGAVYAKNSGGLASLYFKNSSGTVRRVLIAGSLASLASDEIKAIVGAMVSSNTEQGITVTYQDGDNTIDFVVSVNNSHWSGTDLAVENGGTGASDAESARDNLGLGESNNVTFNQVTATQFNSTG